MSLGMSEVQACAGHDIRPETFSRWKNLPEYESLRAKAQFCRLKGLLTKMENEPGDWRKWAWQLERGQYRTLFGDPTKIGVQLNQQFNGNQPGISQEGLEETRKRLDEVDLIEQKWKTGIATNVELRKHLVQKRDGFQHLIDCLDAGDVPDQEEQQRLYLDHEETSDRQQQTPIREAVGRVVGGNEQLAIEDAVEPERVASGGTVMRASNMDWSSGQRKRFESGGDRQESQAPPEPEHVRQRDRKLPNGPPSLRQRLEQEKVRRAGDGKMPF